MASNTKEKYSEFLNNIREIQSNVISINEDDENNKDEGEGGGDDNLDDLLNGNDGDSEGGDEGGDDGDSEGGDEGGDDESGDDEGGDDLGDLGDEEEEGEGDDLDLEDGGEGESKSFETDNEGLMDTITKLTKQGHTVKIIVSAESKQPMISIDGKKKTLKQLNEMLMNSKKNNKNKSSKKSALNESLIKKNNDIMKKNNKLYISLMEQINTLNKKFDKLNNNNKKKTATSKPQPKKPINEEKFIQIKESDYNALIEMAEDMNYKIDEQESLIKNYESMNSFVQIEENTDTELDQILYDLNESVNQLNNLTMHFKLANVKSQSYSKGTDISLGIMTENIMPMLSYINAAKASVLSQMDNFNFEFKNRMNYTSKLNEAYIGQIQSLIESNLDNNSSYNKDDVMTILDEITSSIVIADTDYGYEASIQRPEIPPTKSISSSMQKILGASKGTKSIIQDIPEENWDFQNKAQNTKTDLPIMNYQQITTPTIKSAIANLTESLVDENGNIDLKLCEKAYLYKRVKNPQSFKDFAMPIAIMEQKSHKLYAHPKLIENAANILKNDSCIKTYNLESRNTLYALRESLMPYLKKIGIEAPWKKSEESK